MSLNLTESRDWQLAWDISQHPAVFDRITNDTWGAEPEAVRRAHVKFLVENPNNRLLVVEHDGDIVGCFLFDERLPKVFEVHTMLLPECRGAKAIVAGRQAARMMFTEFGAEKLTSYCPMVHPEILFFALKCGFHKAGMAAMSWIKAGIPWPLETVELTRKDFSLCL